ncbi:hypothetical protein ATOBIA_N06980 [Atopobiaceae bacterium P1]|nr:hypothetical protein ATOBIA_N06980 [Atopobiaceae bacterium P1]
MGQRGQKGASLGEDGLVVEQIHGQKDGCKQEKLGGHGEAYEASAKLSDHGSP